jgi:DNA-binding phage protein
METNTAVITTATNRNILLGIVQNDTTKSATARKAGIPMTTFDRKINGGGDFTLRELGAIAEALGLTLADILPIEIITRRNAA